MKNNIQIVLFHSPMDGDGGCHQFYKKNFITKSLVMFSNSACYKSDYRVQMINYQVQVITHMLLVFQIQQRALSYIYQTSLKLFELNVYSHGFNIRGRFNLSFVTLTDFPGGLRIP